MPKPKYVDYGGVSIRANQFPFARVQNLSIDLSKQNTALEEGGNFAPVDLAEGSLNGRVTIATKDYGSLHHIRVLVTDTGEDAVTNLTPEWFENAAVDLSLNVYPDIRDARIDELSDESALDRTLYMQDAFLDQIQWEYSVGGMATETFNFSFIDARWYLNTSGDIITAIGFNPSHDSDGNASLTVNSKVIGAAKDITALYIDGIAVTGFVTETNNGSSLPFNGGSEVCGLLEWTDTNFTTTGNRYRAVFYRANSSFYGNRSPRLTNSGVGAGQISRGHINIYLTSGDGDLDSIVGTNWLRLQSCSIDLSFNRIDMNEMGNYKPVERRIKYPLEIRIQATAYETDIEDLAKLTNYDYQNVGEFNLLSGFTMSGQFRVDIFDKDDRFRNDRTLLKRLTITGLRVDSIAHAVAVGGKATVDFSLIGTHFALSGYGIMGSGIDMFPDNSNYTPAY